MAASDLIITLTRQEFYERIWATPIAALAKELGVKPHSIVALCDEYQIPRPAMGHWSKVLHGKTPLPVPLPATEKDDTPIKIVPPAYYRARWDEQMEEDDRKIERRRQYIVGKEHWRRLVEMADNRRQSQTVRTFLSALVKAVADDEELTGKAAELKNWAKDRMRRLDPISHDPAQVFETMEKPVQMPLHWDLL